MDLKPEPILHLFRPRAPWRPRAMLVAQKKTLPGVQVARGSFPVAGRRNTTQAESAALDDYHGFPLPN